MDVYGLQIPVGKGPTNLQLLKYARELKVPNFRGVFMRDNLPEVVHHKECGIMNLNKSDESGSHWVCYYKDPDRRIYFYSFGHVEAGEEVIQRNMDIVQHSNTHVCGH